MLPTKKPKNVTIFFGQNHQDTLREFDELSRTLVVPEQEQFTFFWPITDGMKSTNRLIMMNTQVPLSNWISAERGLSLFSTKSNL